jgi:ABC-2 type transport system permease protein
MPQIIQLLTHIVAARYFVTMLQSIFLAGDVWPVLLSNAVGMGILCVVFLGIALMRFHKRLD